MRIPCRMNSLAKRIDRTCVSPSSLGSHEMKVTPKVGWRYSTYYKYYQDEQNLPRNDDTFSKCEGQNSKIEWYHRATDDSQPFLCINYHCRSGSPALLDIEKKPLTCFEEIHQSSN